MAMNVQSWLWDNRTKVIGYLGSALAQLGTSGLIANAKAGAWVAFGSSLCTIAIGHFNDYQARKSQENPQ
jgi:hypothetical protein